FMALAFCLHFPQLKTWQAVLISLLLASNPVSIYQSLSFYVDGQVASILTLLLLAFLLAFIQSDGISLISIFATLLIGLNLKFTATAYVGLITIGLLAAGFYFVKRTLANIPNIQLVSANRLIGNSQTLSTKPRRFRRLLAVTIAGVFMGMLVAGINPYVTNLINYRNPFYPVWGDSVYNQEYIVGSQMPSNFEGKNRFQKLYLSIFSRSQNTYQKPTGRLKFPFSVTGSEIKAFLTTDIRIGGFGPLYGASTILCGIAMFLLFGANRRSGWIALFLSGLVFASAAINPEVWWARYSPQLWLIPVILSIAALLVKQKRTQLVSYLLMGTLLINLVLVSGAYLVGNFRNTEQFDHILTRLSNRQEKILVYYGPLDATATTLDSYHIQYQVVPVLEQLPCPKPLSPGAYYSFAEACPKSP
ncbi:MAG: hypothetical protein ACM3PY_19175, partial [Omnitrophica WOR_2 bacterium]